MRDATKEVHIYANGRGFVVVPVVGARGAVEVAPAHEVPLTLGRPTSLRISNAIRAARAAAEEAKDSGSVRWDGEGGRWWQHHLLAVAVVWASCGVRLRDLDDQRSLVLELPKQTSDGELAEQLIRILGEKLSEP